MKEYKPSPAYAVTHLIMSSDLAFSSTNLKATVIWRKWEQDCVK
jgi:hypothetical protein